MLCSALFNLETQYWLFCQYLGQCYARFAGPYVAEKKLSDTDYVICTIDRKRKFHVCHVNKLNPMLPGPKRDKARQMK